MKRPKPGDRQGKGCPGSTNREVAAGGQSCASGSLTPLLGRQNLCSTPGPGDPALRLFELPVHGNTPTGSRQCVVDEAPLIWESGA